jgi:hypothetical protein
MVDIAVNRIEDRSALHGKVPEELLRRKTDTRPVAPAAPVSYREALATGIELLYEPGGEIIKLAAEKLRRDEQNNAEMVDTLVRAGYTDIPAQIDASVIRRLLGYVTPR